MWRHAVALLAAIVVTLIAFEFWGRFGAAITHAMDMRAQTAVAVSVVPAAPGADCKKDEKCPVPSSDIP